MAAQNCLLISVSTDQLDYISCWTHSLFRESGECKPGHVPMTVRFLIAVVMEHILLALVFVINAAIPDRDDAFVLRAKKAAFVFKRRYLAEQLMDQDLPSASSSSTCQHATTPTTSGLRLRNGAGAPAESFVFRMPDSVDYEGDWRSGDDLSDAYETDDEGDASQGVRGTSVVSSTRHSA